MAIAERKNIVHAVIVGIVIACVGWAFGVTHAQSAAIKKDYINPTPGRFSGAVAAHVGGAKLIYVSGHTGRGNDLKTQAVATYESVLKDLAAAGAGPQDVIKLNTYIANFQPDDRTAYEDAKRQVFPQVDLPASTMVGVQALIGAQTRIEVEAVAVVKE